MSQPRFDSETEACHEGAGKSPWWGVHVARYLFARPHVTGRRTLDIACGTGYGLSLLSTHASQVVGVDLEWTAVRKAKLKVSNGSVTVVMADGCRLPFHEGAFDAITSFETIEHLETRDQFLRELRRVLAPEGLCILSTPNANHTMPINGKPQNPHHVHEYVPGELQTKLSEHFKHVKMLGQVLHPRFVIPPFWDEQESLSAAAWMHLQIRLWRAMYKLPFRVRDQVSKLLWGQPFCPTETDYLFDEASTETAPVLVALCHNAANEVPL